MANPKIKFKRSSVEGKRPDVNSLELGELAINTYDGRVFVKRDTSGVGGIDTANKLINPWIEDNSNLGIACTHNLTVSGIATFTGDVTVRGVLTYQDVTNVDAIGLVTARSGIDVTGGDVKILDGNFSVSGVTTLGTTKLPDDTQIVIGDSDDFKLYHDGDHTYLDEVGQGNLKLRTNTFKVSNVSESKTSILSQASSSTELYYDGTKRLETTSTGALVTGILTATSFVGDGSNLTNITASGSGIVIRDDGSLIGTASSINFGTNLSVTPVSAGVVTVTAASGSGSTANISADTLVVTGVSTLGVVTGADSVEATSFYGKLYGNGGAITGINASNITSGTLPNNRFPSTLPAVDGSQLTGIATFSGDYDDLTNKPTIPTNNNELTNGAGYITTSFTNTNQLVNGAGFITTSFTSYNQLSDKPTIPTNNNELTNGAGYITTSFTSYNQLSDKPTIPTNNNELTNGADYATTTAVGLATVGLASVAYVDQEISNISTGNTTNVKTDSLVVSGVSTLSTVLGTGGTFSTDLYFTKNRNNTVGDGSIHIEPGNSSTAWSIRIDTADNLNFDVNTGSYSELIWFEPDGGAQFSGKVGVATCTAAGEAANKGYVDTQVGLSTANIVSNIFPGRRYTYNSGISSEGDINDLGDGEFWIDTSSSNFTIWVAAIDADNINQFGTFTTTFSHTYNPKQLFTIRDYYNSSPVRHGQWEKISVSSQSSGRKIKFECGSASTNVFHSQGGSISNGDDYSIHIVGWL